MFYLLCCTIQAVQPSMFSRNIQIAFRVLSHLTEQETIQALRIVGRNTVECIIFGIRIEVTQPAIIGTDPHASLPVPEDRIHR